MLCPRCGERERYVTPSQVLSYCKPCFLIWQRQRRQKNHQQVHEYARNYSREYLQLYYDLNPEQLEKANIRSQLTFKVREGKVTRPKVCPQCQMECFVEAHHTDYDHWSHFVWLCKSCHKKEHDMSNPNREYDRTHLSIDMAEDRGIIHRDYLAHCFRWSHVIKRLMERKSYSTAKILDVGCGREMPLAKMLYSNKMSGAEYCGVDINALEAPDMLVKAARNGKLKLYLMERTDAGDIKPSDLPWAPNVITNFECFEHMHPALALRMLKNLRGLVGEFCVMFFSTPCFNGSAANNHVNETTYNAMAAILHDNGWDVINHYGTFASQKDYYPLMNPEQQAMFRWLADYYDSNVLATIFAPLFPHASRNVLWECVPGEIREKKELPLLPGPWSQHIDWEQLNG